MDALKKIDALTAIIAVSFLALDGFLWTTIFQGSSASAGTRDYFLDVGQGDSELIIFSGNIKVMTDAGPAGKLLDSLEKVLPPNDHYIDVAIISHPELDHFNGYNYLLDNGYRFGVFIYNGRNRGPESPEWQDLIQKINEEAHIPFITLGAGDVIHVGESEIDFLMPISAFVQSAALNDTAFVELVKTAGFRTLLTADTGSSEEEYLLSQNADVRADVLKVAHHGSRYSSGDAFLRAVNPRVAVIEVGAKNTYGHPSKEALARLASSTRAVILRTDKNGTVTVWSENGKLKIAKER